jgi:hypothetical protein
LYGKTADEIVAPLLMQIIEKMWGDWTYDYFEEKFNAVCGKGA